MKKQHPNLLGAKWELDLDTSPQRMVFNLRQSPNKVSSLIVQSSESSGQTTLNATLELFSGQQLALLVNHSTSLNRYKLFFMLVIKEIDPGKLLYFNVAITMDNFPNMYFKYRVLMYYTKFLCFIGHVLINKTP